MDKTQDNSPDAGPARQDRASKQAQRQRVLMLLTLMLVVAVLAGGSLLIYHRSLGGGFADELVTVLTWKRDLKAGQEVSPDDVVAASFRESRIAAGIEVLTPAQLSRLAGAGLRYDVRAGSFVRSGDLQWFGLQAGAGAVTPTGGFVEIDENQLEPMPDGRFLGPVQTAEGGRFDSGQDPDPTTPPSPATQPALSDVARNSLAAAGVSAITGDIPDAVAPPGARRLYAFRQVAAGRAADTCAYLIPMSLSAAEKFYKTQLAGKGYNLIVNKDAERPAGRIMTFAKNRRHHYYVKLHPTDKDSEVKAVLVIARPQPQAGN